VTSRTIIIADSLTNDFVGVDQRFHDVRVHVGRSESERLLGADQDYGFGPVPALLRAAREARRVGRSQDTLFVRDLHDEDDLEQQAELLRYGAHNLRGTPGADFVDVVAELVEPDRVIETNRLSLPITAFEARLAQLLGRDPGDLDEGLRQSTRFLVMGVYTDVRVWATANMLRNQYGFPQVWVCPHLVGSANLLAQDEALKGGFANILVEVVPGLGELLDRLGLSAEGFREPDRDRACVLAVSGPQVDLLPEQRVILGQMLLGLGRAGLEPLRGGYSGSLLLLVHGETTAGASIEPLIVKLDNYRAIQRELTGYHRVKGLLGKHVPSIAAPVTRGAWTGVAMELAAMHGPPRTLQQLFENVRSADDQALFETALDSALGLLVERLYGNTRETGKAYLYREFELHTANQRRWLGENIANILGHAPGDELCLHDAVRPANPVPGFCRLVGHVGRVTADFCLAHGDLNLQNILRDQAGNLWFIDWPYADRKLLETDFAKLENDVKFVLCKDLDDADLPRLLELESYLIDHLSLPACEALPPGLEWLDDDPRLLRIYRVVRCIRGHYLGIRQQAEDSHYRIALLRYAVHTLSFDLRSGRGECHLAQLRYALLSVALLVAALQDASLHRETGKEHPDDYPPPAPVPLDRVPWRQAYADYRPVPVGKLPAHDSGHGRNPLGRTGYRGLGFFLRAGENPGADAIVTRVNPGSGELEVLLGKDRHTAQYGLIGTFMRPDETPQDTAARACREKLGLTWDFSGARLGPRQPLRDYRQTDDAFVTSQGVCLHLGAKEAALHPLRTPERYTDVAWLTITPQVFSKLFAGHGDLLQEALETMAALPEPPVAVERLAAYLALMDG
jgi:nicotinamidase-related amidase/ADP-ribose pyrophosphatase YjhB (NUDIX family)